VIFFKKRRSPIQKTSLINRKESPTYIGSPIIIRRGYLPMLLPILSYVLPLCQINNSNVAYHMQNIFLDTSLIQC
jgi:hypothetical protein